MFPALAQDQADQALRIDLRCVLPVTSTRLVDHPSLRADLAAAVVQAWEIGQACPASVIDPTSEVGQVLQIARAWVEAADLAIGRVSRV